jgi:DNA-binding transcriptional LysR family regulator
MAITVTQLTAFVTVVREGSVRAAADELVVTQPSVSAAIAALARELGCELFVRSGRGIALTDAGRAFVPYAEDVIGLLQDGRHSVHEAAGLADGRLQIAAVTTAAESFVPRLMRQFSERHPEIEQSLVVGNNEEVLNRVLTHTDDVAISGRPPSNGRLYAQPFLENGIVCITTPDDPLADGERHSPAELAQRVWLLREPGSGTRTMNERFLGRHGLAPRALVLGSNGAIKQAARERLGISLLSHVAAVSELEQGLLGEIQLTDGPDLRPWFVVRSAVGPVRPTVRLFAAFLTSRAGGPIEAVVS